MPIWLFDRFTRKDVTAQWRWLRDGEIPVDIAATRAILPAALSVEEWLAKQHQEQGSRKGGRQHGTSERSATP